MNLDLVGKTALITGGSRGIGKAVAFSLAGEGVDIAICAREEKSLAKTSKDLSDTFGTNVYFQTADTRDTDSINNFVSSTINKLGKIDILINNAAAPGGLVIGPLETADPEKLLSDIDTKVVGYLRASKAIAPHMKQLGWGRIINIGGLAARSGGTISGMRNIALTHLTKTLSGELGPYGINVNLVHPGVTRTERTKPLQQKISENEGVSIDELEKRSSLSVDVRRMIDASEVANVVTFLASPLSSAVTGEAIAAGGGVGPAVFP